MRFFFSLLLTLTLTLILTLAFARPLTEDDYGITIGPFEPEGTNPSPPPPSPSPPPPSPSTTPPATVTPLPPPTSENGPKCPSSNSFSRASFPPDFIFGTSTSAFQVEGAKNGMGRGLTTWDDFTHRFADKVDNRSDADIATDSYNRWEDDIAMMKELNTNGYRFSISWTRILPRGREDKGKNEDGIQFYNKTINKLVENGIQPAVTLFHWETPLTLEEEYDGFLDKRIVEDFRAFAKLCFELYGDRVKNWGTFNEPWVYSVAGYSVGKKAPGRCSKWANNSCIFGDSGTEPYRVSHNQILAHVAAVEEFRKCEVCKGGKIGITFNCPWFEPRDPNSQRDRETAEKSLHFNLGWFLDPLTKGDYPTVMKEVVGDRLPKFDDDQKRKLTANSLDFVGLNYYGTFFSTYRDNINQSEMSYANDHGFNWTKEQTGNNLLKASSMGIVIYAKGLRSILNYIKDNYQNPEIYIMENGLDEFDNGTKPLAQALNDSPRKRFLQDHLYNLEKAVCEDKVRVKGYFFWSLLDNFEWNLGYSTRFGLYYVDYANGLKRYKRASGRWYEEFLNPDRPKVTSRQSIIQQAPRMHTYGARDVGPMTRSARTFGIGAIPTQGSRVAAPESILFAGDDVEPITTSGLTFGSAEIPTQINLPAPSILFAEDAEDWEELTIL